MQDEAIIDELIDKHFGEWGGPKPSTAGERRHRVERWLTAVLAEPAAAALVLVAEIKPLLCDLEKDAESADGAERFFARIDTSCLRKTPRSILEKIARKWKDKTKDPPVGFQNLHELPDLVRFRIVASFLSDVRSIVDKLQSTYRAGASSWTLLGDGFENNFDLSPAERKTGSRCYKGILCTKRSSPTLQVEIQVTTQLAEAWDKKDHFLIYERRRLGHPVAPPDERELFALSEMLGVADRTFDRIREHNAKPSGSKGES